MMREESLEWWQRKPHRGQKAWTGLGFEAPTEVDLEDRLDVLMKGWQGGRSLAGTDDRRRLR